MTVGLDPEVNPKILIYNASAIKIYNVTRSSAFSKQKIFSSILKNGLAYYNAGAVGM
jgi:hypothetical protein